MTNDFSVNLNRRRDFSTYKQRPQESAKETTKDSIFSNKEPSGTTLMRALDLLGEHFKEVRKQVAQIAAQIDSLAKTPIEPSEPHCIK